MQMFAPNIMVDGSKLRTPQAAQAYERDVMKVRQTIEAVPFGKAVLEMMGNNSQPIVIAPGMNRNEAAARSLAGAKAFSPDFSMQMGDGSVRKGLGGGGVTLIEFVPSGDFRGMPADVVLFHEIVHAWRQARGVWKPVSMQGLISSAVMATPGERDRVAKRFENWEEFLGLVVEGVYWSQQGAKSVRTAQNGMFAGFFIAVNTPPQTPSPWNPVPLTDSQQFAELYKPALVRIMSEEQALYKLMLTTSAWFNPVRDMAQLSTYKASLPPVRDITPPPGMFSGGSSLSNFF